MRKNILKAIALLAIPFAMVGLSSGDTYADVSTIPEGQPFTDINFYNCVIKSLKKEYPDVEIASTGPTNAQLEMITELPCEGSMSSNPPEELKISNVDGLEKMVNLLKINLGRHKISEIDLSHNTKLEELRISSNQLSSLDVSHNESLTYLSASYNQIGEIDVSSNTALTHLSLVHNEIKDIDVTNNPNLTSIDLYVNHLSSIDVSQNPALTNLSVGHDTISSIDISRNPELTRLCVVGSNLSEIDISKNLKLKELQLQGNHISSIDVTQHTALEWLILGSNPLTSVDISNNTALTFLDLSNTQISSVDLSRYPNLKTLWLTSTPIEYIDISNNPELVTLLVDDIFVKSILTRSEAKENTEYDLSQLKMFWSRIPNGNYSYTINTTPVIPTGDGYVFDSDSLILTVFNPEVTRYIQVDNPEGSTGRKYKLVLYEEPSATPEEDIKVPNTGAMNQSEGGALAVFTVTSFVVLGVIAVTIAHKKHSSGHFKYDK